MDCADIIIGYLVAHGYGGLALLEDDGCGCALGDLMPCGEPPMSCVPAYRVECRGGCCLGADCDGWHYTIMRPRSKDVGPGAR